MTADATVNIIKALDKDIIVDSSLILFRMGYYIKRMPDFIQKIIGALASCFTKEPLPSKESSINHVDSFFDIFDPSPTLWTLLLYSNMDIWLTSLPPFMSTFFMDAP